MSLGLHTKYISRLEIGIAGILDEFIVNYNSSLFWKSLSSTYDVEEILPKTGNIREALEHYISETPLFDFLFGLISLELHKNQKYDFEAKLNKLTDFAEYSDTSQASKRLVSELESLPWEYCVSFELGKSIELALMNENEEFQLSKEMKIVRPNADFLREFPLQTQKEKEETSLAMMYMMLLRPKEWNSEIAYLQFFTEGFIGEYIITNPLDDIISTLKSFCGISIALHLFKLKHSYRSATPRLNLIVHRKIQKSWIIESFHELDAEFAGAFSDLEIDDLSGHFNTPEKKVRWIKDRLGKIRQIFENSDKTQNIILAGRWFFESFFGPNRILSFIQIIVALEILLGDKADSEIMGLGALLRNRCAYLIGESKAERENLLKEFKKIYELRSKIVHRGKCRLSIDERILFRKLQWICNRVIQEEVRLILKEENA